MAKKSPQTLQKRLRERDRQMVQREKLAKRLERKALKRQQKLTGGPGDAVPLVPAPAPVVPQPVPPAKDGAP